MLVGNQFRIYPTKEQKEKFAKTFGCTRLVFNYFLDQSETAYKNGEKKPSFSDNCVDLTSLKNNKLFLKEVDSTALQSALGHLERAYENFFREIKKGNK